MLTNKRGREACDCKFFRQKNRGVFYCTIDINDTLKRCQGVCNQFVSFREPLIPVPSKEKEILTLALEQLEKYYDELEKACLSVDNIEDSNTQITAIKKAKEEARKVMLKLIN